MKSSIWSKISIIAALGAMLLSMAMTQTAFAAAGDIRTIVGGKSLDSPNGIHVLPTGEILLADTFNHRVIKIDTNGAVTHIAGSGVRGYAGDGGPAAAARLDGPTSMAMDNEGNLYFTEMATASGIAAPGIRRVRKVDSNGTITSIVTGIGSVGADPCTRSSDDAYFNSTLTQVLVNRADTTVPAGRIYVIAGGLWRLEDNSTLTNWSDAACSNGVMNPGFVTGVFDRYGMFIYWDASDFTVRATSDFQTSNLWGQGSGSSPMVSLHSAESGDLFLASPKENRVYRILPPNSAAVIAGTGTAGYSGDGGWATNAELNGPAAVFQDTVTLNLYIVDRGNNSIRKIGMDQKISTAAGTVETGLQVFARSALLRSPRGVFSDNAGNVYVADTYNHMVRKIDPAGMATTIAGIGHGDYCGDNGPAASACLFYPKGVYADPAGNVYIADTMNDRIRKVDTSGIITTVTGTGYSGFAEGFPAATAVLNAPSGVTMKSTGELFFSDSANNLVRYIDVLFGNVMPFWNVQQPQGLFMTPVIQGDLLYGTSRVEGVRNVNGPVPSCSDATGVALGVHNGTGTVFMACPSENDVKGSPYGTEPAETMAGTGTAGYSGDGGPAAAAMLASPSGVAVNPSGDVYIADAGNDRVRAIESAWLDMTPPGTVASPAGGTHELPQTVTLTCGDGLGDGCQATFYCLGAGCNPADMYSPGFPIQVPLPGVVRYYSIDRFGNAEAIRESVYSVPGPAGWRIHSVMPGWPAAIDWYAGMHAALAQSSYVRIGGTYYFVFNSYQGTWSEPGGMPPVFTAAELANCDQISGMVLFNTSPDLTSMVGQTIEYFATWPVPLESGWTIHGVTADNNIDWYAVQHAPLAPNSYVRINGVYYIVGGSGPGSWNDNWGAPAVVYNSAGLRGCDQTTGAWLDNRPNFNGSEGQTIEYFATWPVTQSSTTRLIAWQDNAYGNNEILLKRSTDSGSTWGPALRVTNTAGSSVSPVLAVDGANVYLAWQDDSYGNNELLLKKSTDGGATWGPAQRITNNSSSSVRPAIAVSGQSVFVAWQDDVYGNDEILLKRSTDSGATWGPAQRITNSAGNSRSPVLAASGGVALLAWQDDVYGNNEILLKRSTDGGFWWGTTQRITNSSGISGSPVVAVDGSLALLAWQDDVYGNNEILLRKSADGGATWGYTQRVSNNSGTSVKPNLALDGQNVYVAWQDDTLGNNEIHLRKSADGGATWWKSAARITNSPGSSQAPVVTVNGSTVDIAWQDDAYGNNEIMLRRSADGGATWATSARITNNASTSVAPVMN